MKEGTHCAYFATVAALVRRVEARLGHLRTTADRVHELIGTPLDETLRFTSPAYLMELYVTARHFAQSPDLYGPIEMRNPATAHVTSAFEKAAAEVAEILGSGDRDRFRHLFDEVRDFFGPFTHEALEQSSYLIDRLVERL